MIIGGSAPSRELQTNNSKSRRLATFFIGNVLVYFPKDLLNHK
jgi:hypothetical protein